MSWKKYALLGSSDSAEELKTDLERGLSEEESAKRLETDGPNLISSNRVLAWQIFIRQLKSPFIYLLLAAALLSFALANWVEGLMIILFIVINTALGFFQEYRSEKTVKLLSTLISWDSKVIRGGKEKIIPTEELVVGDIVVLSTGDKISADARLLEVQDFSVDESSLTGESRAVSKGSECSSSSDLRAMHEACNIVFSGTSVKSGKALAVVIATGNRTEFGKIAKLVSSTKKVSNFELNISKFSSFILKLTILTLAFVVLLNFILKGSNIDWVQLTIFAIALAIGVIPEALPLVMTLSFSKGAGNLAKKKVVVKRLSSVEDLGNMEVLCCDKTGTLTENKMKVAKSFSLVKGKEDSVLLFSLLAATSSLEKHDPFDEAIRQAAGKEGENWLKDYDLLFDSPFDPQYLRNNVLAVKDENPIFLVRGALEVIAPMCSESNNKEAFAWAKSEGSLGRRVLAIASKKIDDFELSSFDTRFREEENELELIGLISFSDPVKQTTFSAVSKAKKWGVGIKIITGDSPDVAGAVGLELGLCEKLDGVMTAKEYEVLGDDEKDIALSKYNIFARVSPEQKYDMIKRLQNKFSVGYLGDGINDAPALKVASVSLAVDNASDIARETADIILLENDLNTIIEGVHEGRIIFTNSIKYIKATLASNFGNFYAVAIASLLIPYLPMLPLQILLLNLLSDFPMIALAGDTVEDDELLKPKNYEIKDIILTTLSLGLVSTIFDFVFFALFSRISPAVLQTNWFIASTITELVFIFSIRSKHFFLFAKKPSAMLVYLTVPAALVAIVLPFTNFGHNVFKFTSPEPKHLLWILGISLLYLASTEAFKLIYYSKKRGVRGEVL